MSLIYRSSVVRAILGFVQVIGIAAVAAAAQQRSEPNADEMRDAICSSAQADSSEEASYLAETEAAMQRMMSDMAARPTGDVDRDFVLMMSPHHQGAIDMAQAVLRHGQNEQIRRLAQEIIVTQQQEIAAMRLAIGDPLPPSMPSPTEVARSLERP